MYIYSNDFYFETVHHYPTNYETLILTLNVVLWFIMCVTEDFELSVREAKHYHNLVSMKIIKRF